VSWQSDEFARSLTSLTPNTLAAYRSDLAAFEAWAARAGIAGPDGVDRRTLRRYLAYLGTRQYARRTIARKASTLRRYFGWLVRTGAIAADPSAGLSAPPGRRQAPEGAASRRAAVAARRAPGPGRRRRPRRAPA
jgi:integrase/recombinase XerC